MIRKNRNQSDSSTQLSGSWRRWSVPLALLLLAGVPGTSSSLTSLSPSPQVADLEGLWKFEGSNAVAADSSGNGHDGSLVNGVSRELGRIGNGVTFDGVDDHATLTGRGAVHTRGRTSSAPAATAITRKPAARPKRRT